MDTNESLNTEFSAVFLPDLTEFMPETDFAKELWLLRQKAIAEGMSLLTGEEISEEIESARNH